MSVSAATVYVAFFWVDRTQDISHRIASTDRQVIVKAAVCHLKKLHIPEPGYKDFLVNGIEAWCGAEVHMTTVRDGKLVLLSLPLEAATSDPRLR